jgi:hypothetical protein
MEIFFVYGLVILFALGIFVMVFVVLNENSRQVPRKQRCFTHDPINWHTGYFRPSSHSSAC